MKMREIYDKIFAEVFEVNTADLNEGFSSDNVENWDSVAQLNLVSSLEDEFDVMFDTDDILELNSYVKGFEVLERMGIKIE